MLLAGKSRAEVAATLGGVSQGTIRTYIGSIKALRAKYPDVVIPKRPYVYRPPKPGHRPLGRPRVVTADQEQRMLDLEAQNKSHTEIAEALGMKRSTVSNYLLKAKKASEEESK
jgi:DNA-binding CsgD family transcriptional regulator